MARRNVDRTVLSCLTCQLGVSSQVTVNLAKTQHSFRLFSSARAGSELPDSEGSIDLKKSAQIKIGNKIYVVKSNEATSRRSPIKSTRRTTIGTDVDALFEAMKTPRSRKVFNKFQSSETKFPFNDSGQLINRQDFTATPESPPSLCTTEGLELNSILKHPLYNVPSIKPFVPQNYPDITIGRDAITEYPFYLSTVREVLRHTKSSISNRNIAHWKEAHLQKFGKEAFEDLQKDLKQHGLDFENLIMEYLKNKDDTLSIVSPVMEAYWESLKPVLMHIQNPQCFQKRVLHPHLRYTGRVDCIATYKSKPVLVEWKKTSQKKRALHNAVDDSVQVMAYAGALNFDPAWPYQVRDCLLIYAYSDGSPADVHFFSVKDTQMYWKMWLRKLEQFWKTYERKPLRNDISGQIQPIISEFPEVKQDEPSNDTTLNIESSIDFQMPTNHRTESTEAVNVKSAEKSAEKAGNNFPLVSDINKEKATVLGPSTDAREECKVQSEQKKSILKSENNSEPKVKSGLVKILWNMWKSSK